MLASRSGYAAYEADEVGGLYGGRWQRARRQYLTAHPTCVICAKRGVLTSATVVDHIVPHRGDVEAFWDMDGWQALCAHCHNSIKQSEEKLGYVQGSAADGRPLDPSHPWNRGAPLADHEEGEV